AHLPTSRARQQARRSKKFFNTSNQTQSRLESFRRNVETHGSRARKIRFAENAPFLFFRTAAGMVIATGGRRISVSRHRGDLHIGPGGVPRSRLAARRRRLVGETPFSER